MNALKICVTSSSLFFGLAMLSKAAEPVQTPHLTFRTIPVEQASNGEHKVMPYRMFDTLVVTVWDPISCGQRPSDESVQVKGDEIYLTYKLSAPPTEVQSCTLVSEFVVSDLPNQDLNVHFAGGAEPYVVAKMKSCPNYKPNSDDIWECLMPQKR